jgi:hypothetical protein
VPSLSSGPRYSSSHGTGAFFCGQEGRPVHGVHRRFSADSAHHPSAAVLCTGLLGQLIRSFVADEPSVCRYLVQTYGAGGCPCSSGVCLCCCIFIGLCIILAIWYRLHALSDAICVPTPSLSAYSIGASSARLIVLVMPWTAGSSRTHSSSWLPPCVWPAGRYIPDPMHPFLLAGAQADPA